MKLLLFLLVHLNSLLVTEMQSQSKDYREYAQERTPFSSIKIMIEENRKVSCETIADRQMQYYLENIQKFYFRPEVAQPVPVHWSQYNPQQWRQWNEWMNQWNEWTRWAQWSQWTQWGQWNFWSQWNDLTKPFFFEEKLMQDSFIELETLDLVTFPPRRHLRKYYNARLSSYQMSLSLSYWLQGIASRKPPGLLYFYLHPVSHYHMLRTLNVGPYDPVRSIRFVFDTARALKVMWFEAGAYQEFDRPVAIYVKPISLGSVDHVNVSDYGVGPRSMDYTGRFEWMFTDRYPYARPWYVNSTDPLVARRFSKYLIDYPALTSEITREFYATDRYRPILWTDVYRWCPDPDYYFLTIMAPVWSNFDNTDERTLRYTGLAEVDLNVLNLDANQCEGNPQRNSFAGSDLCKDNSVCEPLEGLGMFAGAYQCRCQEGYRPNFPYELPYTGKEMEEAIHTYYPNEQSFRCVKITSQIPFPNWVRKRSVRSGPTSLAAEAPTVLTPEEVRRRYKRIVDRRNPYEKLVDYAYNFQRYCMKQEDAFLYVEYGDRFSVDLRRYLEANVHSLTAHAERLAHIMSSYLQIAETEKRIADSVYKVDPRLDEHWLIGELMSTVMAEYGILDASIFFDAEESRRQLGYPISFGVSAIRTADPNDYEWVRLNRSTDGSHMRKAWVTSIPVSQVFNWKTYKVDLNYRNGIYGEKLNPPKQKEYSAAISGVWYGPYRDCLERYGGEVRIRYSVPIGYKAFQRPLGYASIGFGVDLNRWNVNPCDIDDPSNIFRNTHKCDPDTTICDIRIAPYRPGFHTQLPRELSSYQCICRKGYEFPYEDVVENAFRGEIVEAISAPMKLVRPIR